MRETSPAEIYAEVYFSVYDLLHQRLFFPATEAATIARVAAGEAEIKWANIINSRKG